MKTLFIVNDPPYGTERVYNALRLAGALAKSEGRTSPYFSWGTPPRRQSGQKTPSGYYNVEVCSSEW